MTKSESTDISIAALLFPTGTSSPLTICSNQNGKFTLKNECGDSTLRNFLLKRPAFGITSIIPNPARNSIEVSLSNNCVSLFYELCDDIGTVRMSGITLKNSFYLDVSSLSSGNYYLRISGGGGIPDTRRVVVVK